MWSRISTNSSSLRNLPSLLVHDSRLPLLRLLHERNDLSIGDKEALGCLHGLPAALTGLKETGSSISNLVFALNLSL